MYRVLMVAVPAVLIAACDDDDHGRRGPDPDGGSYLTDSGPTEVEARQAVEEAVDATRGDQASAEVVDVTTDRTVGERLAATERRWRAFWESQSECTRMDRDGNVVTVDFGTLDDACAIDGRSFAGIDTITIVRPASGGQAVHHEFDGFTNGVVGIDGVRNLFTSGDGVQIDESDYVVTNLETGNARQVHARESLERLDPNLPIVDGGLLLNGSRTSTDERGEWSMDHDNLAMMVDEGSPFDGTTVVTNPAGMELEIRFSRVDQDTTRAVVRTPRGNLFVYRISVEGEVTPD